MILTHAFGRRMYRGGRPHWLAGALNRISALQFGAGVLAPPRCGGGAWTAPAASSDEEER